jgi:filamin
MKRQHEKDRRILCKYDPTEAGDYQINVKWSGQHVPGSPFDVHIFKTKEELYKYLEENPNEIENFRNSYNTSYSS